MSHARRTHARLREPIVKPRGSAIAQARTDRLMNRGEYLKQYEGCSDKGEGYGESLAVLDGTDEHAHGDGEHRRQDSSQQQSRPPSSGQGGIGLRKHREQLPFLALGQSPEHTSNSATEPARQRL